MPRWLDSRLHGFPTPPADATGADDFERAQPTNRASDWLAAMESGRLNPPNDPDDVAGWDCYWKNHLDVGLMQQAFSDMMASDPELPSRLAGSQVRTILCAGNGLSAEAMALAMHGFDVTAVDLSDVATRAQIGNLNNWAKHLMATSGFNIDAAGVATFGADLTIPPELTPKMHRNDSYPPRGGGRLAFVTGNLMNVDLLPGPFDVVIERCTLQLLPPALQEAAFEGLAARLGPNGVLMSHQHYGAWRPDEPRNHFASEWIRVQRFGLTGTSIERGSGEPSGRRAQLIFTTG